MRRWELGSILALVVVVFAMSAVYLRTTYLNNALAVALEQRGDEQSDRRIRSLIMQGANVNARSITIRSTVLQHAAGYQGDVPFAKELLTRGARVNAQSRGGWSALMVAADGGRLEMVSLLLAHGADPNLQDGLGQTALTCAVQGRRPEVVRILLDAGANPKLPDHTGLTPETLARKCRYPEVAILLDDSQSRKLRAVGNE